MHHNQQTDYYALLGVNPDASAEEIKKAYRKQALKYHPDRNPEHTQEAEARFKELTHAYAVLLNPEKRREYDRRRTFSRNYGQEHRAGTGHSQHGFGSFEDVLRDILNNPEARRVFAEMQGEFAKRGMQFDASFLNNLFSGRGFFVGGVFTFGPQGMRKERTANSTFDSGQHVPKGAARSERTTRLASTKKQDLWQKIGQKVKRLVLGESSRENKDLHFSLSISPDEARLGTEVTIAIERGGKKERLVVKVPAGSKQGTALRLRNKGQPGKGSNPPGDAYLHLDVDRSRYGIRR
ncbi:MAG: DnaJ domain-containing protein [Thermodesulfobacteriota bacterium]